MTLATPRLGRSIPTGFLLGMRVMSSSWPRSFSIGCFVLVLNACAARPLTPLTASSASSTGYALAYPDGVRDAVDGFAAHKKQAHELAGTLPARAPQPKTADDQAQVLYVLDQADADGRRTSSVEARRSDRAVRAFWESERSVIGGRVASTTQKQLTENGCTQVDNQVAVQQALREGVSRQLDKRLRRESEAQRYLDEIKGRLPAGIWTATQRTAEDVALASYLVYVALADDVVELQRLRGEYDAVIATLRAGLDRERGVQSSGVGPKDLEASRERARQLTSRLTAAEAANATLDQTLSGYETQLQKARSEYEQALIALRTKVAPPPPQPAAAAKG
jgi:hypothetical protein